MPKKMDPPLEITHPLHPHRLMRLAAETDDHWPSRCGGCMEPAAGLRYTCEQCGLTLYTCCATAPLTLKHPLFPRSVFDFLERPPPAAEYGRACDACGDLLHKDGFVYHSRDPAAGAERGLDLHPRCARLPARAVDTRRYAFELRRAMSPGHRCGICMCGKDGYRHNFWSYRFYYDDEAAYLHMACLKELASQSHDTLTKMYDILMDGMQWMPAKNLGAHHVDGRPHTIYEEEVQVQGNVVMTKTEEELGPTLVTITHPRHRHTLRLLTTTCNRPFECDACKEPGDGPRYHCRTCSFDMHMFCAEAPDELQYALIQGRKFELRDEAPPGPPERPPRPADGRRLCDTCGDPVKGLVYHCSGANLDLHPCCASLHLQGAPKPITLIDGLAFDIGAPTKCSLCRTERGRRHREQWSYHTDIDGEGVYLHVACVKHLARRRWLAGRHMNCGPQIMLASEELMKEGPLSSISSEQGRKIVGAAVRIIITVIFGDPTAIVGDVDTWVPLPLRWLADLFSIQS